VHVRFGRESVPRGWTPRPLGDDDSAGQRVASARHDQRHAHDSRRRRAGAPLFPHMVVRGRLDRLSLVHSPELVARVVAFAASARAGPPSPPQSPASAGRSSRPPPLPLLAHLSLPDSRVSFAPFMLSSPVTEIKIGGAWDCTVDGGGDGDRDGHGSGDHGGESDEGDGRGDGAAARPVYPFRSFRLACHLVRVCVLEGRGGEHYLPVPAQTYLDGFLGECRGFVIGGATRITSPACVRCVRFFFFFFFFFLFNCFLCLFLILSPFSPPLSRLSFSIAPAPGMAPTNSFYLRVASARLFVSAPNAALIAAAVAAPSVPETVLPRHNGSSTSTSTSTGTGTSSSTNGSTGSSLVSGAMAQQQPPGTAAAPSTWLGADHPHVDLTVTALAAGSVTSAWTRRVRASLGALRADPVAPGGVSLDPATLRFTVDAGAQPGIPLVHARVPQGSPPAPAVCFESLLPRKGPTVAVPTAVDQGLARAYVMKTDGCLTISIAYFFCFVFAKTTDIVPRGVPLSVPRRQWCGPRSVSRTRCRSPSFSLPRRGSRSGSRSRAPSATLPCSYPMTTPMWTRRAATEAPITPWDGSLQRPGRLARSPARAPQSGKGAVMK
jgi:hypothetical protein